MVVSNTGPERGAEIASEVSVAEAGHVKGNAGSFDDLRPPSEARLDQCVHCGFCLPGCPTYVLWGQETDSPRGRIDLMKGALEGRLALDRSFLSHIDACLGCMGCLTSCPSGVRYDEVVEATRQQLERNVRRSPADRMLRWFVFSLFPYPNRVRAAALAAKLLRAGGAADRVLGSPLLARLAPRAAAMAALVPESPTREMFRRLPRRTAANGQARMKVGLMAGCVARVFFSPVNTAAIDALSAEGCEVLVAPHQGCCGALSFHSGRHDQGVELAKAMVDAWEGTGIDRLVVDAAGCGSTVKDYGRLLADEPGYAARAAVLAGKAVDVTELLADLPARATRHPLALRVAYHDACHLAHAQGVRSQPRELLAAIPGVELLPIAESDLCCGSAGIYNIVQPEPADALGRRKAAAITAVEPDLVATANPGCLMQIRKHLDGPVPVVHPVELVAASIAGRNPWADGRRSGNDPASPGQASVREILPRP